MKSPETLPPAPPSFNEFVKGEQATTIPTSRVGEVVNVDLLSKSASVESVEPSRYGGTEHFVIETTPSSSPDAPTPDSVDTARAAVEAAHSKGVEAVEPSAVELGHSEGVPVIDPAIHNQTLGSQVPEAFPEVADDLNNQALTTSQSGRPLLRVTGWFKTRWTMLRTPKGGGIPVEELTPNPVQQVSTPTFRQTLKDVWQRRMEIFHEVADDFREGAQYFTDKIKAPFSKRRHSNPTRAKFRERASDAIDKLYVTANTPRLGDKAYTGNVAKQISDTQGNIKDGQAQHYDPLKSWELVHRTRKIGIPIDPAKAAKQAQNELYASRHTAKYIEDATGSRVANPDRNSANNVLDYQAARKLGKIGHKVNEAKFKLQDIEAKYMGVDLHDDESIKDFKKNSSQTFMERRELSRSAKQARKLKRVINRNEKILTR